MFESKAGAYPGCFIRVGYSFTLKHYTRLERRDRDERSSLFGPSVSYKEKSFVNTTHEKQKSSFDNGANYRLKH
jgi:hypothetical protein